MQKNATWKVLRVLGNILLYAVLLLCLAALLLSIFAKKSPGGAATLFGYQMRTILSPSMEAYAETDVSEYDIGALPVGTMIFIETVPTDEKEAEAWYAALEVGDVLTFRYTYASQETITHRITGFNSRKTVIYLAGDNKSSDADTLTQSINIKDTTSTNYVIGKVVAQNYPFGIFVTALAKPVGIVCFILIPATVLMIFEIIRLVFLLGEKKRQAQKAAVDAQAEELALLKARLAALEQVQADASDTSPSADNDTTN